MVMDRNVLEQYIDACELVKETEQEIAKIKRQREVILRDSVKGSMHDFPFTEKRIHIQGLPDQVIRKSEQMENRERLLVERKEAAEKIKREVETWMNTIPPRMQRIIRFRVFEGLVWGEVAARMGRRATADSVRKEFENFVKRF